MRVSWIWPWLFTTWLLAAGGPARALPKFAREYGVECQTCHAIPPRLNKFGRAFQANYYNWPAGQPPSTRNRTLRAYPLAAIAQFSFEDNRTEHERSTKFRELELFFADGFRVGKQRNGGGLIDAIAATGEKEHRAGDLEQAFAALPVAGQRGQWALVAGQFSPLRPQWEHHTQLTDASPLALEEEVDKFSFAEDNVALQLDYFDHRREGTADGRYLRLGVPFEGSLALNSHSRLRGARGIYAHAFRRRDLNSLGAFAFTHAGNTLGGLIGTRALREDLYLQGIAAIGHDDEGSTRRLSVEGEYVPMPRLAFTARLDVLGGHKSDVGGTAAVTYYPFKLHVLRLTMEATQRKGNRVVALFARGQF